MDVPKFHSPAIAGVTGSVTIIHNTAPGAPFLSQAQPENPTSLSLATIPALQGMLLDQKTQGALSPAIAAVGGRIFIYGSGLPKVNKPSQDKPK